MKLSEEIAFEIKITSRGEKGNPTAPCNGQKVEAGLLGKLTQREAQTTTYGGEKYHLLKPVAFHGTSPSTNPAGVLQILEPH